MPELNIVEKVMALEAVELLRNLSPEQLARIASIAREVSYPPDKPILDPAQPADALYVIVDGAVEIRRDGEALATAHRNEVLGAWALFDEDPLPVRPPRSKIPSCCASREKTFTTCSRTTPKSPPPYSPPW